MFCRATWASISVHLLRKAELSNETLFSTLSAAREKTRI
jgi:hypothetical protein